jgi:EAL domain-containing protein (putative c-di-GMP-specific phosphodiesterase class I)
MSTAGSARSEQPQTLSPQREVAAALRAGELELHFQPIVALRSGAIRGVEALVRWRRPDGGLLFPDSFLPSIEQTPAMELLTRWVVEQACRQAAAWAPWSVSVNVAAVDVVRPSLVDVVEESLAAHRLPADRLVIELTEHAAVQGLEVAGLVLERLRALGVNIALDDFGTGYSSLLYLRDLPVNEIKVDRRFIDRVDKSDDDAAIVQSIVRLAKAVSMSVVAEGVETEGQARYLQSVGCQLAQGYRYARPAPAADVPRELDPALFHHRSGGGAKTGGRRLEPVSPETIDRLESLVEAGASLHTIAAALNRDGLLTERGKRWTSTSVARALSDGQSARWSATTNAPPRPSGGS